MRFEDRPLNICELFIEAVEDAKTKGKRIETAYMTQSEFDDFYQLAMNCMSATDTASLMNRKYAMGVQIVIEEKAIKTKKDSK